MSRRDTIIVAVLINAGLLIVLFASSLKSNRVTEEFALAPAPKFQEVPDLAFKKDSAPVVVDEVDHALNQFTQNAVAKAQSAPVTIASDFLEDLKLPAPSEVTPPLLTTAQTLIAPVLPQTKSSSDFSEVTVKKGDVLEKIARHHHTTVAEIMKANKLTSTNLRIGQVLKIPNKTMKKAETSVIALSPQPAPADQFYTVKKGDTPWSIAVKNHMNVDELLKLNNMSEGQARSLKPGDQLRIQ